MMFVAAARPTARPSTFAAHAEDQAERLHVEHAEISCLQREVVDERPIGGLDDRCIDRRPWGAVIAGPYGSKSPSIATAASYTAAEV